MVSVMAGWQCPRFTTPIPESASKYSCPLVSVNQQPDPFEKVTSRG